MKARAIGLDQFGQPFYFRLPDGRRDKRTFQGLVFTVIISIAICSYSILQFLSLINYNGTTIMVS